MSRSLSLFFFSIFIALSPIAEVEAARSRWVHHSADGLICVATLSGLASAIASDDSASDYALLSVASGVAVLGLRRWASSLERQEFLESRRQSRLNQLPKEVLVALQSGDYPTPKKASEVESELDYFISPSFWYFEKNIFHYLFVAHRETAIAEDPAYEIPMVSEEKYRSEIIEARVRYGILR